MQIGLRHVETKINRKIERGFCKPFLSIFLGIVDSCVGVPKKFFEDPHALHPENDVSQQNHYTFQSYSCPPTTSEV